MAAFKARSFGDAMVQNHTKFGLAHTNTILNSAGRQVWGYIGVEAVAHSYHSDNYGFSTCTDVPEEWEE